MSYLRYRSTATLRSDARSRQRDEGANGRWLWFTTMVMLRRRILATMRATKHSESASLSKAGMMNDAWEAF